jgi:tetratricopeptide (TPR) repeat protein
MARGDAGGVMGEGEKSPFENLIAGPSGWPVAFEQLRQLAGARGAILFLLLAAVLFVWWKWEDIVKRPGVERFIGWFNKREVIPIAPAGHLTIAVAKLGDDKDDEHSKLLLDELGHFEGVKTVAVPRIDPDKPDRKKAEEEAQGLLKQTGADVLIWGSVISLGSKSAMRLYWTPSRDVSGAKASEKYLPQTETLALPELFWSDLKQILGLLTQTRLAELTFEQPGQFVADKLAPLIAQVRALVESKEGVWNPETLAGVRFSLATALETYGEQSGKNEPLAESSELYRKVLDENTRERVPLQWAATQNNLGTALETMGERESGTETLTKAVDAYRETLKEFTPERAPLQWAATQNNLGNALAGLGKQESGTETLTKAVEAYREALKERTHERVPLDWAATQNNLGNALAVLGERESGTQTLTKAVEAYREALQERTHERVPLDWAATQNNLGNVLYRLGEHESGTETLTKAVDTYREALTVFDQERSPYYWQLTQRNLNVALALIAERQAQAGASSGK